MDLVPASNVSFDEQHILRRVRSTGDIPDIEPSPSRPSRRDRASRRSEGQHPPSPGAASALSVPSRAMVREGGMTRTIERPPPAFQLPRSTDLREVDRAPRQTNTGNHGHQRQPPIRHGPLGALLTFLGYQGRNAAARKEVVGLVWNISFAFVQFVVIITLLAFSAHHKSPTKPEFSEWDACERPLGAWDSIWLVRVALGAALSIWGFKRDRATRIFNERRQQATLDDLEIGRFGSRFASGAAAAADRPSFGRTDTATVTATASRGGSNSIQLPHTLLYTRLSLLTSLISLSWFLTAHILEYTSTNTCRHTSPHLWWLTFGILCILYLMILEIFLLGLLVFILGPIIYVAWSLVLLCLGRHPLQNPFYIKPEIGKLSKSVVDQIPLVLYIPAPPEDSAFHVPPTKGSPISVPQPIYTYPPASPTVSAVPPKRKRFAFLRKKEDKTKGSGEKKKPKGKAALDDPDHEKTWEDHWEAGDYPFVRLEGNRAACAICLMDFEEPKRVDGSKPLVVTEAQSETKKDEEENTGAEEVLRVDEITREDRETLHLEDAGEGAQPLRLLACGHVFHKTCLDPWLTDVSGRCPVCQRPVELPETKKPKKRRGNASRTNADNNTNNNPPSQ
ncbi:hypothetical protein EIP91_011716 [Steccherinum ochraceum]|uniref:RING-type domain-containing protein n=1 Tax=Steccherinum ochraceum TaxID=92696 RepID=A0A4R0S1P8_9APHY|nr:hypothetical protein EIP91_011716 [Steccherinum ochraceum]